MAPNYVKDVMETMGWTDGSYLPIANDENKELMEAINELYKEQAEKESEFRQIDERCNNLKQHLQNAEIGVGHNLKLLSAVRNEAASESHLYKLTERERSKLEQDFTLLKKDMEEHQRLEDANEKEINRVNQSMENLTANIKWAKQCLLEWQDAMARNEATAQLIEKYCREDAAKAKELDTRRIILQNAIMKQRHHLIEICDERKSMEAALDRTAELYREHHNERRNLVNIWKEAVNHMNQRESDIETTEVNIRLKKRDLAEKRARLRAEENFLIELIADNHEIESTISDLNEEMTKARKLHTNITDDIALKESEIGVSRKQLDSEIQQLKRQRSKNRMTAEDMHNKEDQMKTTIDRINELQERYDKFSNKHMNAQERLQLIEEMVDNEEKIMSQLAQEMTRVNGISFKMETQLVKLKDEEVIYIANNGSVVNGIQGSKKSRKELDKQLQSTIEVEYELGLKIQIAEMRLAKFQGVGLDIDQIAIQQTKLRKLETQADIVRKQLINVKTQIEKLESDMKNYAIIYNNNLKEIDYVGSKIKEAELYVRGGTKQMKIMIQTNQEKIVELSILKIRVQQMESEISKCDNKVFNLEKHQLELEKAMDERMLDIKTQTELLMLKRKNMMEELSALKMDIAERNLRIEACKKRYELGVDLLGKNDDGTSVTATQLRIQNSQEKQLLLHEGNELNDKVIRAEGEIKAMENTLCLFNYSNVSYKKNFEKLDDDNPEYQEYEEIHKNYCDMLKYIRDQKIEIRRRTLDIEQAINRRDALESQLEDQLRIKADNDEILTKIHKELMDQNVKLERATNEAKRAHKAAWQRQFAPAFYVLFEKDICLRELESRNMTGLQLIGDLIDHNTDMAQEVKRMLCDKGLKLPHPKSTKSTTHRSEISEVSTVSGCSKCEYPCPCITPASSLTSLNQKTGSSASIISIDFPDQKKVKKKLHHKKQPAKK